MVLLRTGAWRGFLYFLLRYVSLLTFYSFSFFGVDIHYGEFLIFLFPLCLFLGLGAFRIFFFFFGSSMVSGSVIRVACPSISILFMHLGGSLGVFPHLENFFF